MKKFSMIVLSLCVWMSAEALTQAAAPQYEASWESLAQHEAAPEWLKDAKLGIYFHWGPYSVPAFHNEWYPRWMFFRDHSAGKHHIENYGDPSEFGYHDFVPMFTAEHFDPEDWAELFQRSGARFAGPVAEHHDGYAMWDSEVTPWNSMDTGPKRDILGELFESLEKRDMKTIATFHHARNLQRYDEESAAVETAKGGRRIMYTSHYPWIKGDPSTSDDPALQLLYGNMDPDKWHEEVWLGKLVEVIDKYQPDIIWFDSWLEMIPESHRQRFCAYYLNEAAQWDKEVVIIRKQEDLPINFTVNDHEKSREPKVSPVLWMTDDTISTGSWCYTDTLEVKPVHKVIHTLVDTVAKNGVVLLNISPKADGSIPEDQRSVLLGLGDWLATNGEAIYETRPWKVGAEGPTSEPEGGFKEHVKFLKLEYSHKDIRYTASKDGKTVYAMLLGDPEGAGEITLEGFKQAAAKAKSVALISGEAVAFKNTGEGLQVQLPQLEVGAAKTVTLKIKLK
ncbi:MAG: alpha-L-fucosidase [Kiritimatiellaceae bacterium]|nr:MAG: alpha-L-fucosidase [Kiritimatiellaceae bacterium]|tara:strand:- start:3385 stop:4905 length:1521 start_codon:yes stop_codon:yes gene_type:complete